MTLHRALLVGSEAVRNLRARYVSSAVRMAIAAVSGLLLVHLSIADVGAIEQRHLGSVAEGRYVWRASGVTAEAAVPASRCAELAQLDGVVAAGAVLDSAQSVPRTAPQSTYDLLQVSAGYVAVAWPGARPQVTGGLLVGAALAGDLGLTAGSVVTYESEGTVHTERIAAVMPTSPRIEAVDRAFVSVSPPADTVRECLIEASPGAHQRIGSVLTAWFEEFDIVTPSPLDVRAGAGIEPNTEFADRYSRHLWLVAALLIGLMTALLWYTRRAEFALYAHLGLGRPATFLLGAVEVAWSTWLPVAAGALIALASHAPDVTHLTGTTALLDLARLQLSLLVLPVLVIPWTARRSVVSSLKGD